MSDFFDLPADERADIYNRAEDANDGTSFHDLPAEERAYWHERGER